MFQHSLFRGPRMRKDQDRTWKYEEITAENFPNMGKEIINQVQEAQSVPNRINQWRNTLRHIAIKLTKVKDKDKNKILKSTRGKQQITYKGTPTSSQLISHRNSTKQHDMFKVMKEKKLKPKMLYCRKTLIQIWWEIKRFPDKQKLKEFSTTKPALQQMLKELL